jgi:hypothetical protein
MIEKNFVQMIPRQGARQRLDRVKRCCILGVIFGISFIWLLRTTHAVNKPITNLKDILTCATNNFHADLSFLDTAKPIHRDEFFERRDRLAQALIASDADAFVLEPGFTFQYVAVSLVEDLFILITYDA